MTQYISFCGEFIIPNNVEELEKQYPKQFGYEEVWVRNRYFDYDHEGRLVEVDDDHKEIERYETEYRQNLEYEYIDGENSLSVYLAKIDDKTGHLVADCSSANWCESTFVVLTNGKPTKSNFNLNPNPVRQLV